MKDYADKSYLRPPKPTGLWRDPGFRYHGAATHADSSKFRKRQQQRAREARQ